MAKINQGILGGFSGKVGGIVGSSWKGIAVMKAKPLSVANPKTAGQVTQRKKFASVQQLGSKLLTTVVKPLFDHEAQRMSGYNMFNQLNIEDVRNNGKINLSKVMIAPKDEAESLKAKLEEVGADVELKITWDASDVPSIVGENSILFFYTTDENGENVYTQGSQIVRASDLHCEIVVDNLILIQEPSVLVACFQEENKSRKTGTMRSQITYTP